MAAPPRLISVAVAGGILGLAGRGGAHHPVEEQHPGHVQPLTYAAFELEAAGFRIASDSGRYQTLRLRGEVSPTPIFGLSLVAPGHRLAVDGRPVRTGPGDLSLGAKLRLFASRSLSVTSGVAAELPTGSPEDGLGSGHLELAPFLSAMRHAGPLMLHSTLGINVSLAEGHDHTTPVYVNLHASRELLSHAGATYSFASGVFLNGVLAAATVLSEEDRGDTFLSGAMDLGLALADWRIALGGRLPIAGDRRFDWKVVGSVTLSL